MLVLIIEPLPKERTSMPYPSNFDTIILSVSEFNEFKPRLKSNKNRFYLSAGLNLEKLNTILS